jgi:hypothetical protein
MVSKVLALLLVLTYGFEVTATAHCWLLDPGSLEQGTATP